MSLPTSAFAVCLSGTIMPEAFTGALLTFIAADETVYKPF